MVERFIYKQIIEVGLQRAINYKATAQIKKKKNQTNGRAAMRLKKSSNESKAKMDF